MQYFFVIWVVKYPLRQLTNFYVDHYMVWSPVMSVMELWRIMDKLSKGEITPRLIVNREDSVTAKGSPENAVANV